MAEAVTRFMCMVVCVAQLDNLASAVAQAEASHTGDEGHAGGAGAASGGGGSDATTAKQTSSSFRVVRGEGVKDIMPAFQEVRLRCYYFPTAVAAVAQPSSSL